MNARSLLQRRPALGLVIGPREAALSVVATTPRGRREVAREAREYEEDALAAAVHDLLRPWLPPPGSRRPGPWVRVALPESRVFQAALAITEVNRLGSPQNFFLEAVHSTSLRAEDRIIDLIRREAGRQPIACLCACPRALVTSLAEMLGQMGARLALVESSPASLLRAAAAAAPPPRGGRLCMRFFLGRGRAIGVTAVGSLPLFWHAFDLPPGREGASILAAHSTLRMLGRHSKIVAPVGRVFLHGRPDLDVAVDPAGFQKRTGSRLVRVDGPGHDLASAALGAALSSPLADADGHDLAREFKPPVAVRDVFPWGEAFLQGAIVAGASLLLCGAAADVETRYRTARSESAAFSWLREQGCEELEAERKLLEDRLRTLGAFRQSRVDWSAQLRTIAEDAPATTVITSLLGDDEAELGGRDGRGKPKKQLVVDFATPLAAGGAMPGEIDRFISELREEPAILGHFPTIEVSGLRNGLLRNGREPMALYSVVCLPRAEAARGAKAR
ncbi:hypothetical protein OJF2_44150 [Aquisphaera giovannonii]|uniref:Uncharacterized protein n=1 Tax=Aquisphaera giovannonii TaxID=406548 RepID=A0A5B9W5H8_9BACT|nr:hypothetical protein [Aquisphaera giovannonii]QEH35858.1 hypothetical protein OJF2_44150 [Aquisphaera giovannonii]